MKKRKKLKISAKATIIEVPALPRKKEKPLVPAGPWRGIVVVCKKGRATVQPENGWTLAKTREFMDRTFASDAPHRVFWAAEET